MVTAATPTSLSEALMDSMGTEEETLAVTLTLEAVAPDDLRPVKDGIETAAEVMVAILVKSRCLC